MEKSPDFKNVYIMTYKKCGGGCLWKSGEWVIIREVLR